jgi:hypothetical protein
MLVIIYLASASFWPFMIRPLSLYSVLKILRPGFSRKENQEAKTQRKF